MPTLPPQHDGGAADTSTPRTVSSAIPELLPLLRSTGGAGNSYPPPAVLAIPSAVTAHHRVQVSIRGRRYETSMEVALAYCFSFFVFFHWPFHNGDDGEAGAAASGRLTNPRTVGEAMVTEAAGAVSEAALLEHYTRVVMPVLRIFLAHQTAVEPDGDDGKQRWDISEAATSDVGAIEEGHEAIMPPLPHPVRITYDASTHVWQFHFAVCLTPEEVEAALEKRRCSSGATVAPTDDPHGNPFLLLQNDYMGVLLVYLRRCAKAHVNNERSAATNAAVTYPTLPIRWAEMNYDEQVSFIQLLRCFGVVPLVAVYPRPTALLSTSLYIGADAAATAARAMEEDNACSLRIRAEKFAHLQEETAQRRGGAADHPVIPTTHSMEASAMAEGREAREVGCSVLSTKGCVRCGLSGHTQEECPY